MAEKSIDLHKAFKFLPVFKNYDWGSTSEIQKIAEKPEYEGEPLAEMWMGSHKNGDGTVVLPNKSEMKFSEFLKLDPENILGEKVVERFGAELPFLFKLLAAEKPLSVQAHPQKEQAEKGFKLEEKKGIPVTDPKRTFKDKNHKPEMIFTLTEFYLLKGFKPLEVIVNDLKKFCPVFLKSFESEKKENPDKNIIKAYFAHLITMTQPQLKECIDQTLGNTGRYPGTLSINIEDFYKEFGYDPGVLSPLFMNILKLESGKALYNPSGVIHAYLYGTCFEVMANSDNVARGGLTKKYIDAESLLEIGDFSPLADEGFIEPDKDYDEDRYITSAREFTLSEINLHGEEHESGQEESIEIFFFYGDECEVLFNSSRKVFSFETGESFIIPACARPYKINGNGKLYKTSVNI